MGATFKQPPVHRKSFDAYGKAWQRRSGRRKTRALQSVRVQSVQYLEVLNDNHFHLLDASAAARSSQQELCYVYATPKPSTQPSTLILSHTSVWPRASVTYQKESELNKIYC
jgi:hypothetical protein